MVRENEFLFKVFHVVEVSQHFTACRLNIGRGSQTEWKAIGCGGIEKAEEGPPAGAPQPSSKPLCLGCCLCSPGSLNTRSKTTSSLTCWVDSVEGVSRCHKVRTCDGWGLGPKQGIYTTSVKVQGTLQNRKWKNRGTRS